MPRIYRDPKRGFSLIELMIAIALLGLVLGTGVPAYQALVVRERTASVLSALQRDIALARSHAAQRRLRATLCPLAPSEQCGSDWSHGRMLFLDRNGDGQRQNGEAVLRIAADPVPLLLAWKSALRKPYLQLLPSGMTNHVNGSFVLCGLDGDPRSARALIVNKMGRARVSRDRNRDGVHEDASGGPLRCP